MPSKAITEKREQGSTSDLWRPARETAPSVVRAEDPTVARWLGLGGLLLVTVGSVALVATAAIGVTAFLRSRRGAPNRQRQGDVGRGFLLFHGAAAALTIIVAVVAVLATR